MRRALLVGATGLVGQELLRLLLADRAISGVTVLVRRPLQLQHEKLTTIVTDFEQLTQHQAAMGAEDVYCALGTTIGKAGSQEAFWRVDHDYPLAVAKLARAADAYHFLLVSAAGANPRSRIFYSRVKGELEGHLQELEFPALTIARPSLLMGDRSEFRLGERLMMPLGRLFPRRWRAVHAHQVARALVESAHRQERGVHVLDNVTILQQPVRSP